MIRTVQESDLDRCYEIERTAYSGDEAATREKIRKRIRAYPEGFVVLENEREIVGFINSGATHEVELSDEAFKELVGHDPDGEHVVIMSLAVHPAYQGQGFASTLMAHFINRMKGLEKSDIFLICQAELVAWYARFGFVDLGPSSSSHGGLVWNEMSLALDVCNPLAGDSLHENGP